MGFEYCDIAELAEDYLVEFVACESGYEENNSVCDSCALSSFVLGELGIGLNVLAEEPDMDAVENVCGADGDNEK